MHSAVVLAPAFVPSCSLLCGVRRHDTGVGIVFHCAERIVHVDFVHGALAPSEHNLRQQQNPDGFKKRCAKASLLLGAAIVASQRGNRRVQKRSRMNEVFVTQGSKQVTKIEYLSRENTQQSVHLHFLPKFLLDRA